MVILYSVGFLANTFYFFQYPPGHAPIRHLFDLILFYFIFRFELSEKLRYVLLASVFVVTSIFTNKEYGVMMAGAFMAGWIYRLCYQYWYGSGVNCSGVS